jgi:RND family efflux transporter MFP subunit
MKYLILMMILIMSFLVGCSADALEEEQVVLTSVETQLVVEDTVRKTYISIGEVVPNSQVDLLVTGKIDEILLQVGQEVEIDDPILTIANNRVKSSFNSSESQLRTLRDNLKAEYDQAVVDLESQKQLLNAGIISQSSYNNNLNRVNSLKRQYDDAVVNYNNQLNNLRENLNDQVISSTIDGIVAAMYVRPGQVVNNQVAVTLIDNEMKYISTFVSSDLKRNLKLDQVVKVMINNEEHEGVIARINELPDPQNKLFEVWIAANDSYEYLTGEFAEIEYVLDEYQAILVPTKALVRQSSDTFVYLLDNNRVEKIKVEALDTKGNMVAVTKLSSGSRVIVKGQNYVIDGEEVIDVGQR